MPDFCCMILPSFPFPNIHTRRLQHHSTSLSEEMTRLHTHFEPRNWSYTKTQWSFLCDKWSKCKWATLLWFPFGSCNGAKCLILHLGRLCVLCGLCVVPFVKKVLNCYHCSDSSCLFQLHVNCKYQISKSRRKNIMLSINCSYLDRLFSCNFTTWFTWQHPTDYCGPQPLFPLAFDTFEMAGYIIYGHVLMEDTVLIQISFMSLALWSLYSVLHNTIPYFILFLLVFIRSLLPLIYDSNFTDKIKRDAILL